MSTFHSTDTDDLYADHFPLDNPSSPRRRTPATHDFNNRDVTWITTSQLPSRRPSIIPGPPPQQQQRSSVPSRPLPIPPPGFTPSEELDAEYMTVDPAEYFDGGYGEQDFQSQWRKGSSRNFVGGFVSGLKKLPRAVLRKPLRRGTSDTGGTGDTLPTYQPPILTTTAPSAPDILYVEALDMPTEHLALSPSEAHSHHTDGHSYRSHHSDGRSHHTHHSDGRSHHTHHSDSRSHRTHHSDGRSHYTHHTEGRSLYIDGPSLHTDRRSHHTDRHSHHTDAAHSHRTTHSIGHDHTYDTHATAHSTMPYDIVGEEGTREATTTTMIRDHPVPASEQSPEPVDLLPSSDYDKMELPPSETSLNSRFIRFARFFQDLSELPWIATRITADYIPAEQSRARNARKGHTTWYPDHLHSPIDLISGSQHSPPQQQPQRHTPPLHPRHNSHRNPNHNSSPNLLNHNRNHNGRRPDGRNGSPPYDDNSDDGRGHRRGRSHSYDRYRSRSPPYSRFAPVAPYPIYPQGYAPEYAAQPLYVYSATIPPPPPQQQTAASITAIVAGQKTQENVPQAEKQEARPVYMLTSSPPPPFIIPSSDQMHAQPPGGYYPYPTSSSRIPAVHQA